MYKEIIIDNLTKTMKEYSYSLVKTVELKKDIENCVFKKDDEDIIIFTFNYETETSMINHVIRKNYLNNGFYRKEINGYNGYYGIMNESNHKWEKYTYLLNDEIQIMTISKLLTSKIPMNVLVKNYSEKT